MENRLIQYIHNLSDQEFKKRYLSNGFFRDVKLTYDAKQEIDTYVENRAKDLVLRHNTDESNNAKT